MPSSAIAGKLWVMSDDQRDAFVGSMHAAGIGLSMKENSGVTIDQVVDCVSRAAADDGLVTGTIRKTVRRT